MKNQLNKRSRLLQVLMICGMLTLIWGLYSMAGYQSVNAASYTVKFREYDGTAGTAFKNLTKSKLKKKTVREDAGDTGTQRLLKCRVVTD
jgi:hypothetical protein